ncbi:MAG: hypothetical protein L0Y72_24855 [Gemmataceae bacterium]|nr:hypothetical protein [Gemmataceae bacterium]MCI0742276.1 hypothetical protein [Gemmataceae bacterium]
MPIIVKCKNPECGRTLRVKDEHAGKTAKCPDCQQLIKIPVQLPSPSGRGVGGEGIAQPAAVAVEVDKTEDKSRRLPTAAPMTEAPLPVARPMPADSPLPVAVPMPAAPKGDAQTESAPKKRTTGASDILSFPSLTVRARGGFKGIFSSDKVVVDTKSEEPVGVVSNRQKRVLGLFPTGRPQWEVRETPESEPLLTVFIDEDRTLIKDELVGYECEVADDKGDTIGTIHFQAKKNLFSGGGSCWIEDANENKIATVGFDSGNISGRPASQFTPRGHG